MISGVVDFYYNVSNMQNSVEFYTKILNMKVVFGDEYWTSLDCGGVKIGLHSTENESAIPSTPRDSHGQHCGGTLTLRSDNILEDKKILENAHVKILGEDDAPWGHMLVFEDLDGNVLKLMNPKQY